MSDQPQFLLARQPGRRGRYTMVYVIVDADDYEFLRLRAWTLTERGYPTCGLFHRRTLLHHLLIGQPIRGFVVDHINGNPLDNRRCNLRMATMKQSAHNRVATNILGATGVNFFAQRNKYRARISIDGRRVTVGYFATLKAAIAAREQAERKHYGEFAACVSRQRSGEA